VDRIALINNEQTVVLAYLRDDDIVSHVRGNKATLNPIEDLFEYMEPSDLESYRLKAEVDKKYKATTVTFQNDTKEGVTLQVELIKSVEAIVKALGFDEGRLKVHVPRDRQAPVALQLPGTKWYFLVAPRYVSEDG